MGEQQANATSSSQASLNGDGRTRSEADMQARVEAYQQDFDRTLNDKIKTIDKELKTVDRNLERAAGHNKRNLTNRKEKLTEQQQNLQKLADSPDGTRQKEFEAYQRQFDQAVNDQISSVDQKLAEMDQKLEKAKRGGAGGAMHSMELRAAKSQLLQKRADLQKVADTPDAALEALKARHERENNGWTASDVGHLALDILGVVPGLGNLADGANAAWYTAEGRYDDAAWSVGAAVVGAGIGVTIAKWFGKGAKSADDVAGAAKGPDAQNGMAETPDAGKVEGTKPSLAERRRAQKEAARQREVDAQIDKGIKRADSYLEGQLSKARAKGDDAAVQRLEAQKNWLDENPRNRELAYDPDKGTYSINETQSALRAEEAGLVKGPLKRDIDVNGGSSGGDFIDADGKVWDHKFTLGSDADKLMEQAKRGENLVVDVTRIDPSKRSDFVNDLREKIDLLGPDTGDIKILE